MSPNLQDKKKEKDCKVVDVVQVNQKKDEDEEDWLPPPPRKIPNSGSGFIEDKTLQELRFVYPQVFCCDYLYEGKDWFLVNEC